MSVECVVCVKCVNVWEVCECVSECVHVCAKGYSHLMHTHYTHMHTNIMDCMGNKKCPVEHLPCSMCAVCMPQ